MINGKSNKCFILLDLQLVFRGGRFKVHDLYFKELIILREITTSTFTAFLINYVLL